MIASILHRLGPPLAGVLPSVIFGLNEMMSESVRTVTVYALESCPITCIRARTYEMNSCCEMPLRVSDQASTRFGAGAAGAPAAAPRPAPPPAAGAGHTPG